MVRNARCGTCSSEAERHRELARNTRQIVSITIGKGVLSTAWEKKKFELPRKGHVEACGRATVLLLGRAFTNHLSFHPSESRRMQCEYGFPQIKKKKGACCQAPTHARAGWAQTSRTSPRNNPNTSEQTRMMGFGELDCTMFCVSNKCNRRRAP